MDETIEKEADDSDLEEGLRKLHERAFREDASKAVDGIELIEFELDGLCVEVQSHLEEVDCKPDDHNKEHDRIGRLGKNDDYADEDADDVFRIDRLVQIAEHIRCIGRDRNIDRIPQQFESEESHEQDKRTVELLTAGDLSLFARVGALFRRWFFCLFARETLEVKDESAPIGGRVPQVIYFHTFH